MLPTIHFIAFYALLLLPAADCIICSQCNGWHGYYPERERVSTCDNLNNACSSTQFCVKIVDPIEPSKAYSTFKSDCWYQTQLQVTPHNLTHVENNKCYGYIDNQVPPKQWMYCFCNDRDHCNSAQRLKGAFMTSVVAALLYLAI
uniref:Protein sleepless n=1 Tax=Steinernema glaseri TaxID=37863 RepID=A0A1I7ZLW6_9BILA